MLDAISPGDERRKLDLAAPDLRPPHLALGAEDRRRARLTDDDEEAVGQLDLRLEALGLVEEGDPRRRGEGIVRRRQQRRLPGPSTT